jgi:hypothetical protein
MTPRLPLDEQVIAALQALGFIVGAARVSARQVGDAVVTVKRTGDLRLPEFEIEISLPSGAVLKTFARRRQILDAAGLRDERLKLEEDGS